MGAIAQVVDPVLSALAESFDLRWRDYRLSARLPPNAGGRPVPVRVTISAKVPFVLLRVLWSSTRDYDGGIVTMDARTREATFIDQPIPLDAFGRPGSGGGGEDGAVPPAWFFGNEEITINLDRLFGVDPAETYPGAVEDSIITIILRGVEAWPKGSLFKALTADAG
jgi:hypothetical protein